ncbi:ABC transporter substrate-binding protein [Phaeovulum sp. W22_SRMD_FR3]|uniref:ABC transporter substrate-binding protein n=1 Tax=Phaeovulum sp. W22_SRMD_FR3 TaxID=3240274 RepID=UPI003F984BA1
MTTISLRGLTLGATAALAFSTAPVLALDLQFYFPVAVGGGAATTIQELTDAYMAAHPEVKIEPVYTGSYTDTIVKAMTAAKGGNPPQLAVIGAAEMFNLIGEDVIAPFDDYVSEADKAAWLGGFYPAFMENSQAFDKTWGIPFQRSTPVMYWNKDAFKAAGLDPEHAPATWDEMVEMAQKLTIRDTAGNVTQWGVRIPTAGFPYWLFQGVAIPNDGILASADGTQTAFNSPESVEAAEKLVALTGDQGVMEQGTLDWGATPKAFFEGNAAMIWTTTGNLTNITQNAPFPFGVGFLPAAKHYGAPTGGGNFYLFKDSTDAEKKASVDFVKWMTAPEQAAKWTIATGYVAPRAEDWETPALKEYAEQVPGALVARDQLQYAKAELTVYQNAQITQILNSALEAIMTGQTAPKAALDDAQAKADAILKAYR